MILGSLLCFCGLVHWSANIKDHTESRYVTHCGEGVCEAVFGARDEGGRDAPDRFLP